METAATSQDLLKEGGFLKNRKRFGLFAGAEETGRDAELVVDGHGDAAFARAVELGDDEPIKRTGFVDFLGLIRIGGGLSRLVM